MIMLARGMRHADQVSPITSNPPFLSQHANIRYTREFHLDTAPKFITIIHGLPAKMGLPLSTAIGEQRQTLFGQNDKDKL